MAFGFRKRGNAASSSPSLKVDDIAVACSNKDADFLKNIIKNDSEPGRRGMALVGYQANFFPNSDLGSVFADLCVELNLTTDDVKEIGDWMNNL